ncbi:MAG: NADH:flavin oxidoreductase / NADH oxidase [Betaproteobacteria bacterium RIFCSPLOWO2_12_FULL_64_23]|nr:MAG: NADH:flavin oxidoreductase / NADH oxidase [Betaproteobacteria bacterium RIFCSPLOWO2_12_FULL_64_23]
MPAESIGASETDIRLFEPLALRGITLKNRVVVSPMSMYSSHEGFSDDFHLVHLGRFALGDAGLVITEATAVSRDGRITHGCNGIWLDAHVPNLRRITDFLHRSGSAAGIQLGHSGPKGAGQRPWHGNGPLGPEDAAQRREYPWPIVSSSPLPFDEGWATPHGLAEADMDELVLDYRSAARRAREAGFDVIELHCAHAYLLHAFLSPLLNKRDDKYGGSLENRMRLPLRIAETVRAEWPEDRPLFVRISAVDGVGVGWSIEDSVVFTKALAARGIDAIACSSGGVKLPRGQALVSRDRGFQVPFAAHIRQVTGIPTIAVGLILEPRQAEEVLRAGDADLIALGREMLFNPNWAAQAAVALKQGAGWKEWPDQYAWWLERRARQLSPRGAS